MSPSTEKLAVLFADICGSTALYENLGDDLARRLILRCINTMSGRIAAYQGRLIKTIGDEIMCAFHRKARRFICRYLRQHGAL